MTEKKAKTAQEGDESEQKVEELISKISINKYDPYQLKSSIDEEIVAVSKLLQRYMYLRVNIDIGKR